MSPLIPGAVAIGAIALFATQSSDATSLLSNEDLASPLGDDGLTSDPIIDYSPTEADMTGNIDAMIATILEGEANGDWNALVGGGSFTDTSHHPGWTDSSMKTKSAWAGWNNSHAAGGLQFQPATYKDACQALGLDGSMSVSNQTSAGIWLIKRRGAYDDIVTGQLDTAISKLKPEWQFLTTSRWNANVVKNTFSEYGGVLA